MINKNDLLNKIKETTTLPIVSIQAMKLLRDPNASIQQVTQCFQYDPGLTANIIKLANSSLFSTVVAAKTLQEAIVRIGFKKTLQLLIGMSMAPDLKKPVLGYDMQPGQLWTAAVSGAIYGEIIARELNLPIPELLFTCCMLRDIGKIVLSGFVEINVEEILKEAEENNLSFEQAEKHIIGFDHGEAGAVLMESWNMPDEFVETARWHHRPLEYQGNPDIAAIINLVHVADIFSSITGDNDGRDGLNYRIDDQLAEKFGLNFSFADKVIYEHELKIMELKSSGII